jgi:hypothetical protein
VANGTSGGMVHATPGEDRIIGLEMSGGSINT